MGEKGMAEEMSAGISGMTKEWVTFHHASQQLSNIDSTLKIFIEQDIWTEEH